MLGRIDQPHTFTYVYDFGKLLAYLGTRKEALGQVWFTPSSAPVTQEQLVNPIQADLEKPVKTIVGSPLIMRFLGLFDKTINETMEIMFEWINPYMVDTSKAEKAFGWTAIVLHAAIH